MKKKHIILLSLVIIIGTATYFFWDDLVMMYEIGKIFIFDEPISEEIIMEDHNSIFTDEPVVTDIPEEYLENDNHRFSSLAYHPGSKKIIFTLQSVNPDSGVPNIKVICYDLGDGIFKLIDDIVPGEEINDMGAVALTIDSEGNHAALDIFTLAGDLFENFIHVYNLKTGERQNPGAVFFDGGVQSVSTDFWDENRLVFSVNSDGQNAKYEYEPETGKTSSY